MSAWLSEFSIVGLSEDWKPKGLTTSDTPLRMANFNVTPLHGFRHRMGANYSLGTYHHASLRF